MKERLLRITEVAERFAMAPATIRKFLYERRLTGVRVGRAVRIRESDVEAVARVGLRSLADKKKEAR